LARKTKNDLANNAGIGGVSIKRDTAGRGLGRMTRQERKKKKMTSNKRRAPHAVPTIVSSEGGGGVLVFGGERRVQSRQ